MTRPPFARPTNHLPSGGRTDFSARQIGTHGVEFFCVGLHFAQHLGQLGFHFFAVFLAAHLALLAQLSHGTLGTLGVAQQLDDGGLNVGQLAPNSAGGCAAHSLRPPASACCPTPLAPARAGCAAGQHGIVGLQHGLLALNAFFNGLQRSTQGKAARLQQLAWCVCICADQRIDLGLLQVWVEADAVFVGLFSLQAPPCMARRLR